MKGASETSQSDTLPACVAVLLGSTHITLWMTNEDNLIHNYILYIITYAKQTNKQKPQTKWTLIFLNNN